MSIGPVCLWNEPMADVDPSTDAILGEIAAAPSPEALEEMRVRVLGRRGSLTLAMRELGGLDAGRAAPRRRGIERRQGPHHGGARRGGRAARSGRARTAARRRARRRDPAGAFRRRRADPSDQPDDRRDRRDLWRDGLCGRRRPAYRGGFLQLHRAQHSARAPGAAGARHLLSAGAAGRHPAGAAHPHLAGADPHDAGAKAADPDHRARADLPLRPRRDAFADVSSGRRAGHRPDDPYGASEGLPDRVLPRLFRSRRSAGALSAELFSVHRAVGRGRYRLLAPGRRIEDRRRRRLARDPRQRHGASAGAEELRHRPVRVSGICVRHGDRAGGNAEIRHPRSADILRVGSALAAPLRLSAPRHSLARPRPLPGGAWHEDDVRLAEDPSRHRCSARRDRRAAGHAWPRCRGGREPRRRSRTLHRRLGRVGGTLTRMPTG